ncbi:MAG: D-alanyl-D-alanine carboxypeptidase, partial [Alphaproteobacteria bacterium]|nr:D-alanyl-D-alanine carboxypeptidase [Alphaproteobacteria bacterium]
MAMLLVLVAGLLAPTLALAGKAPFSAIAVDARTGKIISSVDPDGRRHPASLTKMMTLYLVFEDLRDGKITLRSPIRMSARAAAMAPSKLGAKPGATISVETAIKALVVKSANDVAAAVAENLGGTEKAFAERMTKTARALGMSRTTFKNASGLPNPDQWTTARDMATLGLRLQRDFPQYYAYFKTTSFSYGGRTIKTHNRLLGRYKGTDGIKTGYIAASGFNLTTSALRNGKRVVGVVMGGKTAPSRNAYMVKMLDKAFPKCVAGKTIAAAAGTAKGAIEPVTTAAAAKTSETNEAKKPAEENTAAAAEESSSQLSALAEEAAAEGAEEGEDSEEPKVIEATIGAETQDKTGEPAGKLPFQVKKKADQKDVDAETVASISTEGWNIQIGTYGSKEDA